MLKDTPMRKVKKHFFFLTKVVSHSNTETLTSQKGNGSFFFPHRFGFLIKTEKNPL